MALVAYSECRDAHQQRTISTKWGLCATQPVKVLGDARVTPSSFLMRVGVTAIMAVGASVAGHHAALEVPKALVRSQLFALLPDGKATGEMLMGLTAQLRSW